jgi:hypothetical protein
MKNSYLRNLYWLIDCYNFHSGRSVLSFEQPSLAKAMRSWVRIPFQAWIYVCVCWVFVLSYKQSQGMRLADLLIKGHYLVCIGWTTQIFHCNYLFIIYVPSKQLQGQLKTELSAVIGIYIMYKQNIKCKIWGFHGGDYEESCLLRCYALWLFLT